MDEQKAKIEFRVVNNTTKNSIITLKYIRNPLAFFTDWMLSGETFRILEINHE